VVDIQTVLNRIRPGAEWTLDGDSYEGLTWLDDSPKPTAEEVDEAFPVVAEQIAAEEQAAKDAAQELEEQRASAMAKLAMLGLTPEEVRAVIGL